MGWGGLVIESGNMDNMNRRASKAFAKSEKTPGKAARGKTHGESSSTMRNTPNGWVKIPLPTKEPPQTRSAGWVRLKNDHGKLISSWKTGVCQKRLRTRKNDRHTQNTSCLSLGDMLRRTELREVHFMSLGVMQKGGALMALEQMDWTIPVHVLSVRVGLNNKTSDPIKRLLGEKGYVEHEPYRRLATYYERARGKLMYIHGALAAQSHQRITQCLRNCPTIAEM